MQTCMLLVRVGALVGGLLLLGPARAPITPKPPVIVSLAQSAAAPEYAATSPSVLATRALLGVPVTTADGVQLGQLSDVLIDPTEGRVTMGIVATGGWLGLGMRFTALPWPMLRPVVNGMRVIVVLGPGPPHLPPYHGASEAVPPQ